MDRRIEGWVTVTPPIGHHVCVLPTYLPYTTVHNLMLVLVLMVCRGRDHDRDRGRGRGPVVDTSKHVYGCYRCVGYLPTLPTY